MHLPATHRRDRWQRRISQLTRTVAVIAVAGTLALSVVAARTFAGKAKTGTSPQTRTVTVLQAGDDGTVHRIRIRIAPSHRSTGGSQTASGSQGQPQTQQQATPPATTAAPPATVSGGS